MAAAGIKLVGVSQPNGFSPDFQGMFTPRGSRSDKVFFWGGYPVTTVAMATLLRFSSLKIYGYATA